MNSKLIWLLVLLVMGLGGYYIWKQIPDAPKSQTFSGYTQTLHTDELKAQAVASSVNLSSVQQAVNKYKEDKGSLPTSLQDLSPDYLDHVPGGVQYDASTGIVTITQ